MTIRNGVRNIEEENSRPFYGFLPHGMGAEYATPSSLQYATSLVNLVPPPNSMVSRSTTSRSPFPPLCNPSLSHSHNWYHPSLRFCARVIPRQVTVHSFAPSCMDLNGRPRLACLPFTCRRRVLILTPFFYTKLAAVDLEASGTMAAAENPLFCFADTRFRISHSVSNKTSKTQWGTRCAHLPGV